MDDECLPVMLMKEDVHVPESERKTDVVLRMHLTGRCRCSTGDPTICLFASRMKDGD